MDLKLKDYATPRQVEVLEALAAHGTERGAAEALGCSRAAVRQVVLSVKSKAALAGYSPEHGIDRGVAPGYVGKGHSTLDRINADGSRTPVLQWTKTKADEEARLRLIDQAFTSAAEVLPRLAPLPAPPAVEERLLNFYPATDVHIGMHAFAGEGGADWTLESAEREVVGCFEALFARSQPARVGMVALMGDFLHYDGPDPVTPTHRHALHTSGTLEEMIDAAIRVARRVIDLALLKHEIVVLAVEEGNHDYVGAPWLRRLLAALYELEPRLEVLPSPLPFTAYQHGEVMIGLHHGHKKEPGGLPLTFAASFPAMWGSTRWRFVHTGHRHHEAMKEHPGCKVLQHPTLAARDSHASRGGYISTRQVTATTYDARLGKVGEVVVTPEMLAA